MADGLARVLAFIEARLRDDKALAVAVLTCCRDSRKPWPPEQVPGQGGPVLTEYLRHFSERRALDDAESTRDLVARIQDIPHNMTCWISNGYPEEGCDCGTDGIIKGMLAAVAARWADHPEHGKGWAA